MELWNQLLEKLGEYLQLMYKITPSPTPTSEAFNENKNLAT